MAGWEAVAALDVFRWCRFLRHVVRRGGRGGGAPPRAARAAAACPPTHTVARPALRRRRARACHTHTHAHRTRTQGNVMVLFVLGILGFSWYAVVPGFYGPILARGAPAAAAGALVAIAAFTALAAMVGWSYLAAVVTDPGRTPEGWSPFADEQARGKAPAALRGLECAGPLSPRPALSSPALTPRRAARRAPRAAPPQAAQLALDRLAASGFAQDKRDPRRPRYCKHCQAWKPPRAHHCSAMGRCVLKMDHYCIWVRAPGARRGARCRPRRGASVPRGRTPPPPCPPPPAPPHATRPRRSSTAWACSTTSSSCSSSSTRAPRPGSGPASWPSPWWTS